MNLQFVFQVLSLLDFCFFISGCSCVESSVIIFATDNGGPADGFNMNWSNNYPLRGVKASLYEGTKIGLCILPSFLPCFPIYLPSD